MILSLPIEYYIVLRLQIVSSYAIILYITSKLNFCGIVLQS